MCPDRSGGLNQDRGADGQGHLVAAARHLIGPAIVGDHAIVGVEENKCVIAAIENGAELGFGLLKGFFGLATLGDVAGDSVDRDGAAFVVDERSADFDPDEHAFFGTGP